ncbi:MAG: sigma-54-dependent Fis family transcriptional regulator [Nitrospirae bacterium]|nr:MAG: sigma-54-dependent Fis family transcriptional regulator [Nitrospirota bacterium]
MTQDLAVLLVDDEPEILYGEKIVLQAEKIRTIHTVQNGLEVMPILAEKEIAVVVLDLSMPGITGGELLKEIAGEYPEIPVIIMTANNEIETAVECMKNGAFDYIVKPLEKNKFSATVKKAFENFLLQKEVSLLKRHILDGKIQNPSAFSSIITKNSRMLAIFSYAEAIAISPQPVLITGETGVGKELLAQAIHTLCGLSGEFVAVNIAGLDDNMFSDTLFGHKKGAFTGAETAREGLVSQAENGSLFLDEIGDMQESSQVKLLRLLQEHTYYPLGSDVPKQSNARVIVATNQDIKNLMEAKKFRKDLFFRLRTHHIHIPPLRERSDDIPLLTDHFMNEASQALRVKKPTAPPQLYTLLSNYSFPGNLRELQGMVYDAVARHRSGILSLDSFKSIIGDDVRSDDPVASVSNVSERLNIDISKPFPTLDEAEEILINEALKLADGNQGIAASLLGITRQALNKRLSRKKQSSQNGAHSL